MINTWSDLSETRHGEWKQVRVFLRHARRRGGSGIRNGPRGCKARAGGGNFAHNRAYIWQAATMYSVIPSREIRRSETLSSCQLHTATWRGNEETLINHVDRLTRRKRIPAWLFRYCKIAGRREKERVSSLVARENNLQFRNIKWTAFAVWNQTLLWIYNLPACLWIT